MITTLFFYISIVLMGFIYTRILFRNSINNIMQLGATFGIGIGLNSVIFFLLSLMGIKIDNFIIIAYLSVAIICGLLYMKRSEIPMWSGFGSLLAGDLDIKKWYRKLFNIGLVIILLTLIYSSFYGALKWGYTHDDEWSYWGTATKRIIQTESIYLKGMGLDGFERYPLLIPITSGSMSIFNGYFAENFSKLVSPFSLFFLIIFLFGFLSDKKLEIEERLLWLLLLIMSGHLLTIISTVLYADMTYAYLYSMAVLLFGIYVREKNKDKRILLGIGILFSLVGWAKIDGFIACLGTMGIMSLLLIIFNHLDGLRPRFRFGELAIMIVPGLSIPLLWYAFSYWQGLAAAGWTAKLFSNTPYALAHIDEILLRMIKVIVDFYSFSGSWIIIVMVFIVGLFICVKNREFIVYTSVIILNVLYHLSTYLFVFRKEESMIAASFERYSLHFIPIGFMLMVVVYLELKKRFINEKSN